VPNEHRCFPLDARIVPVVIPERIRGVYLIAGPDTVSIYARESD